MCHDVHRINGKLQGSSQDELVMMDMIYKQYNSSFISCDTSSIKISIRGNEETYEIIDVYKFSSDRKMMSVTVKNLADGSIFNFGKGADNVIKTKLN